MNSIATNNLFSSLKSSFVSIERRAQIQASVLESGGTNNFDSKLAGSKGGFIPHISRESELISRVRRAGLNHYLQPISDPSEDVCLQALDSSEKLMTSKKTPVFNLKRLIQASDVVFRHLSSSLGGKLDVIGNARACELLNFPASAGYPYYKKKGLVGSQLLEDSFKIPFRRWRYFPTARAFRLQLRLNQQNELRIKPRVIYPYPGVITLLENKFVQPLVEYFGSADTAYIIGRNGQYVSERIMGNVKAKKYSVTSDVDAFDQNMPNELVYAGFSVIRQFFKLKIEDAELFENIASYFVSAPLMSRVGTGTSHLIVKTSGIPSGTGFTNIMGTICHLIILAYQDLKWFETNHSLVCGDDNLTFGEIPISQTYITTMYKRWGLTVSLDKTQYFIGSSKVHFLGFDWIHGIRIINPHLALNQVVYHTGFDKEMSFYDRVIARAASVLLNGQNGSSYFVKLFPDLDNLIGGDRTFVFLPGYGPPVTGQSNIIASKRATRVRYSIDEHMQFGWQIR